MFNQSIQELLKFFNDTDNKKTQNGDDLNSYMERQQQLEEEKRQAYIEQTLDQVKLDVDYIKSNLNGVKQEVKENENNLISFLSDKFLSILSESSVIKNVMSTLGSAKNILSKLSKLSLGTKLFSKAKGVTSLVKAGAGAASKAGSVISKAGSLASKAGAVANTAFSAYNYFNADNSEERKEAVGEGIGSAIGGAIGAFIPLPGTAFVGSLVGGWIGSKISSFFSSPKDKIPDKIKKRGAIAQIYYIDIVLNGTLDKKDSQEIKKYRDSLWNTGIYHELKSGWNKVKEPDPLIKSKIILRQYIWTLKRHKELYNEIVKYTQKLTDIQIKNTNKKLSLEDNSLGEINKRTSKSLKDDSNTNTAITGSTTQGSKDSFSGAGAGGEIISGEISGDASLSNIAIPKGEAQAMTALVSKYETGGAKYGLVSSGKGDHGGISYGKYQLASKKGAVQRFLKMSGYAKQFAGMTVNSKQFKQKWRQLAKTDSNFNKAQDLYAIQTYYKPVIDVVKSRYKVDLNKRGMGVKSMIMSLGVQHGAGGAVSILQKIGINNKMTDEELIKKVYAERGRTDSRGNLVHFRSSSKAVQREVAKRFKNEVNDALKINKSYKPQTKIVKTETKTQTQITRSPNPSKESKEFVEVKPKDTASSKIIKTKTTQTNRGGSYKRVIINNKVQSTNAKILAER